jgi:2-dehydro-3-deoxyphosphogluconate aldolase/(4S)-4-hydroxy-2-oxoglutarate aldolase
MASTPFAPGVIAVIRATDAHIARTIVRGLMETSVSAIEITLTVPDAFQLISEGIGRNIPLGVGTVLEPEDCRRAIDLGANFIVSPHLDEEILSLCVEAQTFCIPGVLTPTEIQRARRSGADAVKLFPIKSVGGLDYAKTLLEPFPDLKYIVSGGISVSEVSDYLNAKCIAVCLGKALIDKDAAANGDVDGVTKHANAVLLAISEAEKAKNA